MSKNIHFFNKELVCKLKKKKIGKFFGFVLIT